MSLLAFIVGCGFLVLYYLIIGIFVIKPDTVLDMTLVISGFALSVAIGAYQSFSTSLKFIDDLTGFSRYQEEVEEKIKKLGGNPEDLEAE